VSAASKSRSITTFTSSSLRQPTLAYAPHFQRRFLSDDAKSADVAATDAEVNAAAEAPQSISEELRAAEVQPTSEVEAERTNVVDAEQDSGAVQAAIGSAAATGASTPPYVSASPRDRPDPTSQAAVPSNHLYVGNLFFDVTEEDLKREFSRFGHVEKVTMIYDGRGLSKGYVNSLHF
jgi:nucleolin